MDDESAFQSHLDAHPEDFVCRLVFADWLEERGDVRAEGYRALGVLQFDAACLVSQDGRTWFSVGDMDFPMRNNLPRDWFGLIEGGQCLSHGAKSDRRSEWVDFPSRREAEDAAALAFAKLPAARRAELLAPVEVVT